MTRPKCHRILSLAIVCVFTWLDGISAADNPKESAADAQFKAMDTNGDGKLSPEEYATGAKKMFDTMDLNKDGIVTVDEMDAAHEKVAGRKATKADMSSTEKIKVVDTDGDGRLSAEEHAAGSKKMFEKMDTDKEVPSPRRNSRRVMPRWLYKKAE